ncbi:hypothetical protein [Streptococcus pluranimalium]|uniref:Uncharacterized protein n=1 Tax=Streptococcus pluranimalium TaxID=82348 RepID=A0A345VJL4_9STRE|nr:hypothetical protein [Streptococcus pluranimalium]AXJ12916.1 hypothetical protein Sp14A_09950 [Streptococcus pluranimalium]
MKQTIFNASLEESMNLVTDKYIQTSMENVKEHGVWKKIIGIASIILIMTLFHQITKVSGFSELTFFNIPIQSISLLYLIIAFILWMLFIINIFLYRHFRMFIYTIYGFFVYIETILFGLQMFSIFVPASSEMLGVMLSFSMYCTLLLMLIIFRCNWFFNYIKDKLFNDVKRQNTLANLIYKFEIISKKYGGLLLILLLIRKWFFPSEDNNDMARFLYVSFAPFLFLIGMYFCISMLAEHFQGYYLKKYSEDYRQMSGYSIEEWYGKKSKMYRDSVKQNDDLK